MPLRFNSISNDPPSEILPWLLQEPFQKAGDTCISEDKKIIHNSVLFEDVITGTAIGKYVYTMRVNDADKTLDLIDLDITLLNDCLAELEFVDKLDESSDANEYYQVRYVGGEDHHINIETVYRNAIHGEIEGTVRKVSLSAFPFKLSVYDDIDEFNREFWPEQSTTVAGEEMQIKGFAENYAGCSFGDDIYTMMAGKVKSLKEVRISINEKDYNFIIALLDTAVGLLPTAMSREVFNLDRLDVGKTIFMNADIKADLSAE